MSKSVLVVCHPLRGKQAKIKFSAVMERLTSRMVEYDVRGVYLWEDELFKAVEQMVKDGSTSILLLPYFLHNGSHVIEELNGFIDALSANHPTVPFTVGATLDEDMLIEDALCHAIGDFCCDPANLPVIGQQIEDKSLGIVERRLACTEWTGVQKAVLKRIIHATADFSYINTIDFHPQALALGLQALRDGAPIICDVNMLKAGITRLDNPIHCIIAEERTATLAAEEGCTRAAAAIRLLADQINGAIVAVGNAPTAIWELLRLKLQPAMVIGLPVGFVGAREAKQALIHSDLPHVSNRGERGGSPVAASVLNALAVLLAHERSKNK